jgi:DNA-binding IclR family transcriptional regulator
LNERPPASSNDRCLAILELLSAEDGAPALSEIHRILPDLEARGYAAPAVDLAEDLKSAHCVAAPVYDIEGRVVASLVVAAPSERMPESKVASFGRQAATAAGAISKRLQA